MRGTIAILALATSVVARVGKRGYNVTEPVVTATTYETTTVCPITNTITYGGS